MSAENSSPKILVVDDDWLIRTDIASLLQDKGFEVYEAEDAVKARKALSEFNSFAALITDNNMPGELGASLALGVQRLFPKIAIIMITGGGRPPELGNSDIPVLNKPFNPEILLATLTKALSPQDPR